MMNTHNISRRLFLGALAAPALGMRAAAVPAKHLFLNTNLVASRSNLALRVGKVEKDGQNPLFAEDKPWEVRYDNVYANVLYDQSSKRYRCWYSPFIVDPAVEETPRSAWSTSTYRPRNREMGVCYAESTDGIVWRKPELGLVEFRGSKANNLVVRGPHGAGICFDPHDPDGSRRYKMFYEEKGVSAAFSADGIHWGPRVPLSSIKARADTHNCVQWVPQLERYVAFTRLWDTARKQRLVARTESRDFLDWSAPVEVMRAAEGAPENQTYALPFFEYHGVYLGFVMVFHTPSDTVWCELAWSPDTTRWERLDIDSPLIPLGSGKSYDSGCVYAASNPIITEDEIRIYYGSSNGPHTGWRDGFLGLGRMRPDGFAGITATYGKGTLVTQPVEVTSPNLTVNTESQSGVVRVGVLGADVCQLEQAAPVRIDSTSAVIRWQGSDLQSLVGKKVQLVFELESAKAYSFSFV